jgi:hypothetical protein
MSKIKPVKAWGICDPDDGKLFLECYGTKKLAEDSIDVAWLYGLRAIRVEIRPVTPKKKVRK